jgi:hypothetical protein
MNGTLDERNSDVAIEVKEGSPLLTQSLLLVIACPLLQPLFYPQASATALSTSAAEVIYYHCSIHSIHSIVFSLRFCVLSTQTLSREFKGSVVALTPSQRQWRLVLPHTSRHTVISLLDSIYDGVIHQTLTPTLLRECIQIASVCK